MAPGRFLIDLTDERFKTDQNQDVIDYIRRMNPFAHSDVGDRLIRAADGVPNAQVYCPAPANCAYAVLHTPSFRIFGIAYGQSGLAFRLPASIIPDAVADRGTVYSVIGRDWIAFHPWPVHEPTPETLARLKRWCEIACRHAAAQQ